MNVKEMNSCQIDRILTALPQKYPFMFVDNVIKLKTGVYVHTQKAVSYNEWYFQGHFPGEPILPGNIIVEIMAQSTGLLLLDDQVDRASKELRPGQLVHCNIKFLQEVKPGVLLDIEARTKVFSDQCISAHVIVSVARSKIAAGDIAIAFKI